MAYKNITAEKNGGVGIVTLDRPKAMNALSDALMEELTAVLDDFEADAGIGCIVLTGSEKAFAANRLILGVKGGQRRRGLGICCRHNRDLWLARRPRVGCKSRLG